MCDDDNLLRVNISFTNSAGHRSARVAVYDLTKPRQPKAENICARYAFVRFEDAA
jgi:hypothetical protein